ncbi:MAG: STAS domain-containing protein [Candidatus Brocadiia bacterium]
MSDEREILEHEVIDGVHVLRLHMSDLEDGAPLMALNERMEKLLENSDSSPKVIVNLSSVEYMVTTALAKLVSYRRRILGKNGGLSLCGLQPAVQEVMEITKFDELFDICEDEPQALKAM